jgi:hypothetical protein
LKLVGVVGLIGSGKSTVGDFLISDNGFKRESFAGTLKDATASLFSWPRDMLEGVTSESRKWREEKDQYWSEKLNKDITPRWVLQQMGTEVIRDSFHANFWIMALEKKILDQPGSYVITDARFPNEMDWILTNGGKIIRVKRGEDPSWFTLAAELNRHGIEENPASIPVHRSEWKWIRENSYYDYIIENDSTLEALKEKVLKIGQEINSENK